MKNKIYCKFCSKPLNDLLNQHYICSEKKKEKKQILSKKSFIIILLILLVFPLVSAYSEINGSKFYLDVSVFNIVTPLEDVNISCYDNYNNSVFSVLTNDSGFISSQYLYEYSNKTIGTINFTSAYDSCFGRFTAPVVFETDNSLNILFGDYYGQWFGKTWNGSEFLGNTSVVSGIYAYGDGYYSEPMVFEINNTIYLMAYTNRVVYGNLEGYRWNGNGWDSDSSAVSGLYSLYHGDPPNVFNIGLNWYAILETYGAEAYRGYEWNGAGWTENSSVLGLGPAYSTTFYFNYSDNYYRIFPRLGCTDNQYGINAEIYNGTDWIPTFTNLSTSIIYYSNYTLYANKSGYIPQSKTFNLTSNLGLTFLLDLIPCSLEHLNFCYSLEECEEVGGHWVFYNIDDGYFCSSLLGSCLGARGTPHNPKLCLNEATCSTHFGYWYNGICNLIPYVPPYVPPVEEKGLFSSLFSAFSSSSISIFIIILGVLFCIYKFIDYIF